MKHLVEAVARKIPREINNYHLVKRQDIYIPYHEIGIVCLTKDIADINLFYETILKFIDIGVCDIKEISSIMGVEFKLLKEVIVDMIDENYVTTSENHLFITQRGTEALKTRKLVKIRKKNINQIMINMITGKMCDRDSVTISSLTSQNICLSEEISISKDFLDNNYVRINEIFEKDQIKNSVFNIRHDEQELYKILDFAYDKLVYEQEEILIYKSNDSGDLDFVISGDIGERYLDCFYKQIKDILCPGLQNFFERDKYFIKKIRDKNLDEKNFGKEMSSLINKLHSCNTITDDIINEFMQSRKLIDNKEVEKYFQYHSEIQYEGIIITSNRLRNLLNKKMISYINEVENKKINIFYDPNEYDIVKFLNKQFQILIRQGKLIITSKERLPNNFICFYPNIFISLEEKIIQILDRPIAVLDGRIDFDSNIVKEKIDGFLKENNVSFEKKNKLEAVKKKKRN